MDQERFWCWAFFHAYQLSIHSVCICSAWNEAVEVLIITCLLLVGLMGSKYSWCKAYYKSCFYSLEAFSKLSKRAYLLRNAYTVQRLNILCSGICIRKIQREFPVKEEGKKPFQPLLSFCHLSTSNKCSHFQQRNGRWQLTFKIRFFLQENSVELTSCCSRGAISSSAWVSDLPVVLTLLFSRGKQLPIRASRKVIQRKGWVLNQWAEMEHFRVEKSGPMEGRNNGGG